MSETNSEMPQGPADAAPVTPITAEDDPRAPPACDGADEPAPLAVYAPLGFSAVPGTENWAAFKEIQEAVESNTSRLSSQQRQVMDNFAAQSIAHIVGKENYEQNPLYFHALAKIDHLYPFTNCVAPRRFGRSKAVSMFAAVCALAAPNVRITIFSPGERASAALLDDIRAYLGGYPPAARFVLRDNTRGLQLSMSPTDTRCVQVLAGGIAENKFCGGDILVFTELTHIRLDYYIEVILPLTTVKYTTILAVASPTGEDTPYGEEILRQKNNSDWIFDVLELSPVPEAIPEMPPTPIDDTVPFTVCVAKRRFGMSKGTATPTDSTEDAPATPTDSAEDAPATPADPTEYALATPMAAEDDPCFPPAHEGAEDLAFPPAPCDEEAEETLPCETFTAPAPDSIVVKFSRVDLSSPPPAAAVSSSPSSGIIANESELPSLGMAGAADKVTPLSDAPAAGAPYKAINKMHKYWKTQMCIGVDAFCAQDDGEMRERFAVFAALKPPHALSVCALTDDSGSLVPPAKFNFRDIGITKFSSLNTPCASAVCGDFLLESSVRKGASLRLCNLRTRKAFAVEKGFSELCGAKFVVGFRDRGATLFALLASDNRVYLVYPDASCDTARVVMYRDCTTSDKDFHPHVMDVGIRGSSRYIALASDEKIIIVMLDADVGSRPFWEFAVRRPTKTLVNKGGYSFLTPNPELAAKELHEEHKALIAAGSLSEDADFEKDFVFDGKSVTVVEPATVNNAVDAIRLDLCSNHIAVALAGDVYIQELDTPLRYDEDRLALCDTSSLYFRCGVLAVWHQSGEVNLFDMKNRKPVTASWHRDGPPSFDRFVAQWNFVAAGGVLCFVSTTAMVRSVELYPISDAGNRACRAVRIPIPLGAMEPVAISDWCKDRDFTEREQMLVSVMDNIDVWWRKNAVLSISTPKGDDKPSTEAQLPSVDRCPMEVAVCTE